MNNLIVSRHGRCMLGQTLASSSHQQRSVESILPVVNVSWPETPTALGTPTQLPVL